MLPEHPRVLVTRPQPEATELAGLLRDKGCEAIVAPLFEIVGTKPGTLPQADALLLTSPRSVRFLPDGVQHLPIYAVGKATADAAETKGLKVAAVGPGEADDRLTALLPSAAQVLHLTGEHIARDLAPLMEARGVTYHRLVTYRAEALDALPAEASAFLRSEGPKIVTLLSVRAAEVFARMVAEAGLTSSTSALTAVCFGPRIADVAKGSLPYRSVRQSVPGNLTTFVDFVSSGGT